MSKLLSWYKVKIECPSCHNDQDFQSTRECDIVCVRCGVVAGRDDLARYEPYNTNVHCLGRGKPLNLSRVSSRYMRSNHFNQILLAWQRANPEFVIPEDIYAIFKDAAEVYRVAQRRRNPQWSWTGATKRDIQKIYRATEIPRELGLKYKSCKFAKRCLRRLTDRKQFCLRWWEVKDRLCEDAGLKYSPRPNPLLVMVLKKMYCMFIEAFEKFRHVPGCTAIPGEKCHLVAGVKRCRYGAPNNFYVLSRFLELLDADYALMHAVGLATLDAAAHRVEITRAITLCPSKQAELAVIVDEIFEHLNWPEALASYISENINGWLLNSGACAGDVIHCLHDVCGRNVTYTSFISYESELEPHAK